MLDDLVKKISYASQMSEEEVREKIDEKKAELSDIISDEGAAYIVAKELGINLIQAERLNIANIAAGMQNVDIVGKIMQMSVRSFKTEKAEGRVANVVLADETGMIRLVLWNDEIEKIEGLGEGEVIRVRGYVKEDNMGGIELRLGRYGLVSKSGETISSVAAKPRAERSHISELQENQSREVRAALVQVFEGNVFYEVCPECKSRLKEENDYKCAEHGDVEPAYGIIISGVVDDGTASMRAVFFGEAAEAILGMSKADAKKLFDRKKKIAAVLEKIELGKDFVFAGRVKRNMVFDRLEFVVNSVSEIDVKNEIEILLNRLEK